MFARISKPITYHEHVRRDTVRITAGMLSVSSEKGQYIGVPITKPVELCSVEESPNAWDVLESLAGSVDAPADWASNHDHYLYGIVKRDE